MAKGGALKPVYIVTDEELEINGGDFVLQQGPAMKVRGFSLDNYAGRKIKGGAAQPVYVVPEASAPSLHGGHWRVIAGQPEKVISVTEAERNIIQGPAIPVYPVDDDGNYDPNFAGAPYYEKALSYGPIAYYPLWEDAGVVAEDISGNGFNGAYQRNVAVMGTGAGIGDGNTAPQFNGANDYVNCAVAGLQAAFNGAEGTIFTWYNKDVGVTGDGVVRRIISTEVNAANRIFWQKLAAGNNNDTRYAAGGVNCNLNIVDARENIWIPIAITWSASLSECRRFVDGPEVGVTCVILGVWAGVPGEIAIGNDVGAANYWKGRLAHYMIFDYRLSPAEILDLSTL